MTATRALPPFLAAALPGIHWSLTEEPLYFQSLEQLQKIRRPSTSLEFLDDIPGTVESLFPKGEETEQRHFGLISLGLILLGHGFTDECHNLITPLSWPDDIHFAHGPSVYHATSDSARAYASYVHSLVHRKEGHYVGEFGMMGFANANYWSRAVVQSSDNSLPLAQLQQRVLALAEQQGNNKENNPFVDWCRQHDLLAQDCRFDARAVHQLCATVLRQTPPSSVWQEFVTSVAESEIRLLLFGTLGKAGFHADKSQVLPWINQQQQQTTATKPIIDTEMALSATRKPSSAHSSQFQSQGWVILRQVVSDLDPVSAAAGIACRLLETPACQLVTSASQGCVEIVVGHDDNLSDGDVLARKVNESSPTTTSHGERVLVFKAVAPNDPLATFVDPLYGTRGETPTTVIQWSKGTIF